MRFRSLVISLGMLGLLVAPAGLAAQEELHSPRYTVIELGTLGGTYSQAFYVNNQGVASGEASLADGNWHAILWQGPFKRDLGTLGGLASSVFNSPNAIGQVVGEAETSDSDPNGEDFCGFKGSGAPSSGTCLGFLWEHGSMTPLSTLGGYNGAASMINNRGEVAGNAENTTTDSTCPTYDPGKGQYQVLQDKPVVWRNGQIEELPTYGGDTDGFAIAINDSGQVAGASGACSTFNTINGLYLSPVHALLWDRGGAPMQSNLPAARAGFHDVFLRSARNLTGFSPRPCPADNPGSHLHRHQHRSLVRWTFTIGTNRPSLGGQFDPAGTAATPRPVAAKAI